MSLLYWLPLINDAHNQGLQGDVTTIMGSGITYTNGKLGNAATFPNAASSCLNLPGLQLQTGSWAAWIKCKGEGSSSSQYVISEGRDMGSVGANIFLSKAGTTLYARSHKVSITYSNFPLNTWMHICMTFGTNSFKLYINGTLNQTISYTDNTDYAQSNNRFVLGKMAYGYTQTGSYFPFNGQINDVRVYNHCLSDKEVQEIAKGLAIHIKLDDNFLTDNSGYNHPLVLSNVSNTEDTPRYTQSTTFSGTTSYIKINTNSCMAQHAEAMTINLWAKNNTWATNTHFFSCTESGGFNTEPGNSGYLRFPVYVCTNAEQTTYAYKYDSKELQISAIPVNEWVMLTWVYDNTGTRTYINGQLHHTYTNTSYGIRFNMNARLFLGCEASGANPTTPYYNGQESDFRLYYTALTEDQILELYNTSVSIDNLGNVYARELVEL